MKNKNVYVPEECVRVCGLVDHEDGNAYEIVCHIVSYREAFSTALQLLNDTCDHVCIVDDANYNKLNHTYSALAPYSINISRGIYT